MAENKNSLFSKYKFTKTIKVEACVENVINNTKVN